MGLETKKMKPDNTTAENILVKQWSEVIQPDIDLGQINFASRSEKINEHGDDNEVLQRT